MRGCARGAAYISPVEVERVDAGGAGCGRGCAADRGPADVHLVASAGLAGDGREDGHAAGGARGAYGAGGGGVEVAVRVVERREVLRPRRAARVRSVLQESRAGRRVPLRRRDHQRRELARRRGVHVGAGGGERADRGVVAAERGEVKAGVVFIPAAPCSIRAGGQQALYQVSVPVLRGDEQRSSAIDGKGLDVN